MKLLKATNAAIATEPELDVDQLVKRLRLYSVRAIAANCVPSLLRRDIGVAMDLFDAYRGAVRLTLEESKHLADGHGCTLRHLVRIAGSEEQNHDQEG